MAAIKGTGFLDRNGLIDLVKSLDDRYMGHVFRGATSESNGRSGVVPKPSAGDEEKILFGDGTWKNASINVNKIHRLVWHSITLTSDIYKIVDIYDNYGSLTIITDTLEPDAELTVFDHMYDMYETPNLLEELPGINTSNATSMEAMYKNCSKLVNIPKMNTSSVTNMKDIFYGCTLIINIPSMDTSNVTDMSYAFYDCTALITIPQLDTGNVTNMSYMFKNCTNLTNVPQLNTSKVTDMTGMFEGCTSLAKLDNWSIDCSAVVDVNKLANMLKGTRLTAANLTNINSSIQNSVTDALLKGE